MPRYEGPRLCWRLPLRNGTLVLGEQPIGECDELPPTALALIEWWHTSSGKAVIARTTWWVERGPAT